MYRLADTMKIQACASVFQSGRDGDYMPISPHPCRHPIDVALAELRQRLAVITAIDRAVIETVSHDATSALRLSLLASELRRKIAEVAL
jgi:hypothetical protein